MSETQVEKLTKLRDDLSGIESDITRKSRVGQFLGVGAIAELVETRGHRSIGTYLRTVPGGVQVRYIENGRLLTDVEETYTAKDGSESVVVSRSRSALERGTSIPNMRKTIEFGRIGWSLFSTDYSDECGSGSGVPVSSGQVKYLDELARHFVSQATTAHVGVNDEVTITPHKGFRLPIKSFNKCLPGHGNAMQLFAEHHTITAPDTQLDSGLPFSFFKSIGGEYEGETLGVIVGSLFRFIDSSEYPLGLLFRPHSACCRSEGREPYALNRAYDLENLHKHYRVAYMDKSMDFSDRLFRGVYDPQCDCYLQLIYSQKRIANEGGIYVDFMEQEGRGYGLLNKEEMLRLSKLKGISTPELCEQYGVMDDMRIYDKNAESLFEAGIRRLQIIGNNPRKAAAYKNVGIQVTHVPAVFRRPENMGELESKLRMGHNIAL